MELLIIEDVCLPPDYTMRVVDQYGDIELREFKKRPSCYRGSQNENVSANRKPGFESNHV